MRLGTLAGIAIWITIENAAAAGVARADDAPPSPALELGVRIGYSLPLGNVTGTGTQTVGNTTFQATGASLSDDFNGRVPFLFDAGLRITPNVYLGALLSYGVLFVNGDKLGCTNGISCSGHALEVGANVHYHLAPDAAFDPWLGLGFGYEWATLSASQGSQSVDATLSGFQFVDAQIGGDYRVANLVLGPFVMLGVGQYSSASSSSGDTSVSVDISHQALHEWLTFGVRGACDIHF
jgi:hypothetical protein